MAATPIALVDEPERVRLALSPIRRQLLDRLRTPASATQLASELALGRQRVNYHLRALEEAGLIALVEERQRRGCVERILATRAQAFVVDPSVMGGREAPAVRAAAQDRFAAEHLIDAAARIVRDVARMQARAERQGTRLLTFTIETDITFATPADLERFTTTLAAFVSQEAAKLGTAGAGQGAPAGPAGQSGQRAPGGPGGQSGQSGQSGQGGQGGPGGPSTHGAGRRYRLIIAGHPSPSVPSSSPPPPSPIPSSGDSHERVRSRSRRDPRRRPH